MKVQFCGAAKKVTGSCYYIETSTKKILVDCGMHQGGRMSEEENFDPFPFEPSEIDYVFITHAHLDHSGRIPKLVKDGFRGRVVATAPTIRLATLIMEDSVHILEEEARFHEHDPLYTQEDYEATLPLFDEWEYRTPFTPDDNITVEFFDAGHILGSSMIRITADGKSIVFSGDLGNPPVPLLQPTDVIGEADYVVMESTYGGRIHEDKKERTDILKSAIYETVKMRGVLMIPAFAIERTQEILYEINDLVNNKEIPPVPIFLDSPLAIKATRVYQEFDEYFNHKTQDIIQSGDDVFDFPGLRMTLKTEESKGINSHPAPKIIIAGSGMAQGGRIVHHIKRYISFFANQYLIVGYQVHGSLGRLLRDGEKKVRIHNEEYDVKAKVRAIGGYSAHADQAKLTTWIREFNQQKLQKIFLTHGEEDQAHALKVHFQKEHVDAEIIIPDPDQIVDL